MLSQAEAEAGAEVAAPVAMLPPSMWAPLGHGLAHDSQPAGQVTTCDQSEAETAAVATGADVVATHAAAEDVARRAEADMAVQGSAATAVEDGCHMPSSCAREGSARMKRERERRMDEEEECFIVIVGEERIRFDSSGDCV